MLRSQRSALPWALLAILLAAALLVMGTCVLAVTGQPLAVLVRDANAIAHQPNYFGALDHAGVLLMSGGGWIAAFSSAFCRGQRARFLFLGGLLSLLLATDDLYMLHESAWRFGINEAFIFVFYGLLLILLVAANLREFLKTPFFLLGAAMLLLALGLGFDASHYAPFGLPEDIEDYFELAGICFWAVYFAKCGWDALSDRRADLV